MKCYACIREFPKELYPFGRGWGNGYVLIPLNHKLHGKDYTDNDFPDIDVHCGVTWSSGSLPGEAEYFEFITDKPENIDDYWVLGFDTGHCYDDASLDKEWVTRETLHFKELLEAM